jgi:hypothetical protein
VPCSTTASARARMTSPQAGIALFERGPDGLFAAVRVYDDVEPLAVQLGGQQRLPDIRILHLRTGVIPAGRLSAFLDAPR